MSLLDTYNTSRWDVVANELRDKYIKNPDEIRRQDAQRRRRELYATKGGQHVIEMIDKLFLDPIVRDKYKRAAQYAKFDYAITRIVNAIATVYSTPATRAVTGVSNLKAYTDLLQATRHDEVMRQYDQALAVHNDVFLSFRVREPETLAQPITAIATPDMFWAVSHPKDPTWLVAMIFDIKTDGDSPYKPRYLVWSDSEAFKLNGDGHFMSETLISNPLERIPGVLGHARPVRDSLLDNDSGSDLVDATMAALFEQVLMLKESKSVSKTILWTGDLSTTPSGQMQDTEADNIAGDGVSTQEVERGVTLSQFADAADHVIERTAANYGISPDILRHSGATSGHELNLRRIPLEEQRQQRIMVLRPIEREFADIQSGVLAIEAPSQAFSTDGWAIDYREVTRYMTEKEKYELRKLKRSAGHSNVIAEAIEDNPDFDEKQAEKWVKANQASQASFISMQRALNMSGEADASNPGRSPEQNGADNAPRDDESDNVQ